MEHNNYSGHSDPFQQQPYDGMPTPIAYPNANAPVRPPNVFYPPIDFSVPPPNFAQMNLMPSVQQPPLPPPPLLHQHTVAQPQHNFQQHPKHSQSHSYASNQTRNDRRKETSRWHESQPTTSQHRDNANKKHAAKWKTYGNEMDSCNQRQKDRNNDREKTWDRDRNRDRDREREREREQNRDRSRNRDRDRDKYRERDRDRGREGRERDTQRTAFMRRDERVSMKRDDRRLQQHEHHKNESTSRSRSRSRSIYSNSSSNRNRTRNSVGPRDERDRSKSYESKCRSISRSSAKPETLPAKPHIDDTRVSVEKSSACDASEKSERARILEKWRSNYCETSEDIKRKLEELAEDNEKECWMRSSPADLYYKRTSVNEIEGTARLEALCTLFKTELVDRGPRVRQSKAPVGVQPKKRLHRVCRHKSDKCSSSDSSDDDFNIEDDCPMEELTKKIKHPYRLHPDLWHNEAGEMNDGPLCRCSAKSRRSGIRHGIYPGEDCIPKCDPNSNNAGKLYHYKITVSPPTNFLTKTPTMIKHDEHEFLFEGFSLLSHSPIAELPTCSVIRFNIEYKIMYFEEKMPENFTIRELDLFSEYLFTEILEMLDFSLVPKEGSCSCFHFLPRFVRDLPDNGKEILSMSEVIRHLLDNSGPLVSEAVLKEMQSLQQRDWQDYVDEVKGMVVTNPGMKPCSVRVDQLDRNVADLPECVDSNNSSVIHPVIVHFGVRPPQLSYAGNPEYQKSWREYVKFRHLVANMSKPSFEDKRKLEHKESRLQEMRTQGRMKRNVTIAIGSKGFFRTGIMCDIVQHALLIPVLTTHLRFHQSLDMLEKTIDYKFKNRYLLQLGLTHPSYKENFGTNPDHARNSLTNCGIRQPEYGDRKIHYLNTRKRGINTLINIMSRFGRESETDSSITHNERLEFLGDAVVEFLTSIHLFFMFCDLEEGGLATYRAAIVQNQHLAVLAKKLHLDEFMLYAHGSDLCHELELRHAMANCFEALMGALLLDGGIEVADKVFANTLFMENPQLKEIWVNYPPHPLQDQEPTGDRQWIDSYPLLKDLTEFEDSIGIKFRHIRLLARAFTDRSIGFTHLTLGSNQRLEFLGDTVLQLICSEFLYRHFPTHHEGHLSLLRSSLVNNRTQAVVCDDLGMTKYAIYANPKSELKTKDRADLLEAFLGALYVDKGLQMAEVFCQVCLFPRLQMFIINQDWNDPKSKLQQCCLTLRTMDGGEPDIPIYKVIECTGPTNTRVYKVAVYFRGKRLASSTGHSIQQAEMEAAKKALENSSEQNLFPQLDYQKRVMAKTLRVGMKRHKLNSLDDDRKRGGHGSSADHSKSTRKFKEDDSNLPKQYRNRACDNSNGIESGASSESDTDSLESSHSECSSKHSANDNASKKHQCNDNHQSNSNTSNVQTIDGNENECDESNSTAEEHDATPYQDQQDKLVNLNPIDEHHVEHESNATNDDNCVHKSKSDKAQNGENISDTDESLESGEIL